MTSIFEEDVPKEEPKDRTKWMWFGVGVIFAGMLAALWLAGHQKFRTMSAVRAKHILIQFDQHSPAERAAALKQTLEIRQRIANGEDFGKLARDYSDDSFSSARGGDLGYSAKGQYTPEFEEYVWNAPVGQLSQPVLTSHGFHLIVVLDRQFSEGDLYERDLKERVNASETAPPGGAQTPAAAPPAGQPAEGEAKTPPVNP